MDPPFLHELEHSLHVPLLSSAPSAVVTWTSVTPAFR